MKKKICLVTLLVLLLALAVAIPVLAAQEAEDVSWAVLTYTYDPDTEGMTPQSGKISFTKGKETKLERLSTVTWDAERAILFLDGVPCEGGSVRIEQAGPYELTVMKKDDGKKMSCSLTMLPVIKADDEYFAIDPQTGVFYDHTFTRYPVIECLNVERMRLNFGKLGGQPNFQTGTRVTEFGRHTLELISKGQSISVDFYVKICTAKKTFDEALGKNCLVLNVGTFPGEVSVLLDGVTPLSPGTYTITKVGQHTIHATVDGKVLEGNALPTARNLGLQMIVTLEDAEIDEPITILFSQWDAIFYVDGKRIEGDYRVAGAGDHVFTATDAAGNQITDAFYIQPSQDAAGEAGAEMVVTFRNPHHLYALLLIVPALAMIGAMVYFFLKRRNIV